MQFDPSGTLMVLRGPSQWLSPAWNLGTSAGGNAVLTLENTGDVVVRKGDSSLVWSTRTPTPDVGRFGDEGWSWESVDRVGHARELWKLIADIYHLSHGNMSSLLPSNQQSPGPAGRRRQPWPVS